MVLYGVVWYRIVGACSQSKLLLPCNSSVSPSAPHPARFLVWVQIIQIISQKTKAIFACLGMKNQMGTPRWTTTSSST